MHEGFLEIENEMARNIMLERIKEDKKIYSLSVYDGRYLFRKEPESIDKMPMAIDVKNIFMDFRDSTCIRQSEYNEQLYLSKGKIERNDWDIVSQADTILGKPCSKAVLRDNPDIIAWFTTDVPFPYVPFGYNGLPGLVVRMEFPAYIIDLKDISEFEESNLEIPTKGKKIKEADFNKMTGFDIKKKLENINSMKVDDNKKEW
ncbi:GLPGLI family protein [Prevotella sp. OH937_COT-195]|nr:GLPGLI family protein [Prevotella sp. OH937_COT-195]